MKTLSHWRFVTLLTTLITLLSFLVSMPAWASAQTASASPHTAPSIARVAGPANTAVLTYKNDTLHSGLNSHETILTPGNVNGSQFGKRVSYPVDGQVYAQPLYMPGLTVGGNTFNAVFVATENDTLYAFDADQTDSSAAPLWKASFLRAGETAVSQNDVSCNNIDPLIGITSTPVIDPQTHTLYAVGFSRQSNGSLVYRLHAINITTGLEEAGSPITISGIAAFANNHERQRANLLLANGKVYMAFASFCDNAPYHGFVLSYTYNGSAFHLANVYNDTPNGHLGGIWGGAGALAADNSGNIYVMTGNGTFDLNTGGHDAGDSFVRLNSNLTQADYFAPFNQACLEATDGDLGSGGPLILQGSNYTELIGAGKEGRVYVLNANSMGHFRSIANPCGNASGSNDTNIKQELPQHYVGGAFSTPTTWSSATTRYVYISGVKDHIKAFKVNSNGTLVTPPASQSLEIMGHQGGNPVVSSNGTANGILWVTDGSGLLRAYDATNLAHALFTGFLGGNYVKFSNPMVANGEVFVGTSSTLDIFGEVSSPPGVYNNKGISDDSNRGGANFDSVGHSYSAQALASVGVTPGHPVIVNGFTFQWPNVQPGTPDNWQADGQTLPVTSVNGATTLGILGAADFGEASGTATVHFSDGTSQTFTLGFTDWWQPPTVFFNNMVAAVAPYQNAPTGKVSHTATLYLAQFTIPAGKVVQSVTLPSSITGGQLHVFSTSTK